MSSQSSKGTKGTASCIRGYHVSQAIWEAAVGEVLTYESLSGNVRDWYAVAVKKDRTIIGHLTSYRKVSCVCHFS